MLGYLSVAQHPVLPRRHTGEQRRTRWRAGRRRGIGAAESHAASRQPVQIRSMNRRVAIGTEAVATMLVRHQQQEVWSLARAPHHAWKRRGGCRLQENTSVNKTQ